MPADKINFLNGEDNESVFSQGKGRDCLNHGSQARNSSIECNYDEKLIEVSCKIQEINKVFYKQVDSADDAFVEPGEPTACLETYT